MKKLFTLSLMMIMGCMMTFAQSVEFATKDGKAIANGSTIWATEAEDMGWAIEVSSGIFVKNNGTDSTKVEVTVLTKTLGEGSSASFCPGGNCVPLMVGKPVKKEWKIPANSFDGSDNNINLHWSYNPKDPIGLSAEMEVTLSVGGKKISTVTVMFSNDPNAAGIDSIIASDAKCNVYDITGKLVKANVSKNAVYGMSKGLYIVRELSGAKNVNKVIVK